MRFFRRKNAVANESADTAGARKAPTDGPVTAAERFWRRWATLGPEISAALGDKDPQRFEHQLSEVVAEVHPDLHFAIELGQRAVYALVVSGQEDPVLRPYTDAWLAAAPPEDAIWEYHDSVPPVPDPTQVTINLGPVSVALAQVRVVTQVDEAEGVVDVAVHHPEMVNLGKEACSAMTFLPLDAALGERRAARRLRRVETAVDEPVGETIGLLELRDLVGEMDGRETGDRGGDGGGEEASSSEPPADDGSG